MAATAWSMDVCHRRQDRRIEAQSLHTMQVLRLDPSLPAVAGWLAGPPGLILALALNDGHVDENTGYYEAETGLLHTVDVGPASELARHERQSADNHEGNA